MMYSLDEVGLIPATVSDIKSRKDVNPYVQTEFHYLKLPIFVSPMTCILNANNIETFDNSLVEPILPVAGEYELRKQLPTGKDWEGWTAMTLEEFKLYFNECKAPKNNHYYILIDVANGNMRDLFTSVKRAKQKYGGLLKIMAGNIANPKTYEYCCVAGIDYVRVGIGGGSGCLTSVNTGIHVSLPHLLKHLNHKKHSVCFERLSDELIPCTFRSKIIADGGIDTIGKAIKCLALGADYVMMGKCFAECEEAGSAIMYVNPTLSNPPKTVKHHYYYGQASEQGQLDRFGEVRSEPEGMAKWIPITTDLETFTAKFEAALRSAMSYCGAHNLDEFIGKVDYEIMSPSEFNSFNK